MESLKDKIRRLRKEKGISQVDVAKASGINQASYSNIEKGSTTSISIEVGKGIAKALEISFNELFDIEVEATNSLIDELKADNERLKELQSRNDKESLLYVKYIESLEREIESQKREIEAINEHLITWPEYYILGFIAEVSKDFEKNLITRTEMLEKRNTLFNLIATAFLFSTRFETEFIDKLEKKLKEKKGSNYNYYFKPFMELVRKIQTEYEKEFE